MCLCLHEIHMLPKYTEYIQFKLRTIYQTVTQHPGSKPLTVISVVQGTLITSGAMHAYAIAWLPDELNALSF